ncbi:glycerate kinase [Winogradskyella alexanderae]|uniref:Glycerate kinase n=1 Tax=Winogradskyella alexanderae TaxID=2877123 RepID=A0ABS7XRE5_9FLAO|nr:glycerate kinase [Winogradskyella alexanderae]MCA0131527.1 glycerate kinase [Winogradskyella alexanderae]
MQIILAPDKYKGSITGMEFCDIVEPILHEKLGADVLRLPLADGGDGTIEVINFYLKGIFKIVEVNDPLFRPIKASYLYSESTKIAFIEMAEASGIKLLKSKDQNCMNTTTFGTGELILSAISEGANHIILGIGGSATNDCGIGMATALGYEFFDKRGKILEPVGRNLIHITKIRADNVDSRIRDVKVQIACDVKNPLYGPKGAAHVYAKQKGANPLEIEYLNAGLRHFSGLLDDYFNIKTQQVEGSGAAGGMGAGTVAFLNGELLPGIELIMQIANFEEKTRNADWIITGEGRLDDQTLSGKAISGIIEVAQKHNIKVASFSGSSDLSAVEIKGMGIDYSSTIMDKAISLDDALKNTETYLKQLAMDFTSSF